MIDVPGGEPAVGSSGDRLPDGTVVEIGPGGSATIDGVAYGPGRYLVGGGTLRPDPPEASPVGDSGETPAPAATSSTTTTVPTGGGAPGLGDDHLHDVDVARADECRRPPGRATESDPPARSGAHLHHPPGADDHHDASDGAVDPPTDDPTAAHPAPGDATHHDHDVGAVHTPTPAVMLPIRSSGGRTGADAAA